MICSIPDDELEWTYARSGGPGGQNVNKVESKALLRWHFAASTSLTSEAKARLAKLFPRYVAGGGWLVITSQRYRDQKRNRQACRDKLQAIIQAASTTPKPRAKTKPSAAVHQRRLQAKKHAAQRRANRTVSEE